MNIDNPHNNYFFTPKEADKIRKRVMENPVDGPEAENDFHVFLEQLRRSADLYAFLMFGGQHIKLIDFNIAQNKSTIRDEEGQIIEISL